jgi:hypothetical protein
VKNEKAGITKKTKTPRLMLPDGVTPGSLLTIVYEDHEVPYLHDAARKVTSYVAESEKTGDGDNRGYTHPEPGLNEPSRPDPKLLN